MPIPVPVSPDWGTPASGGLLSLSRSLPDGWQRGISFLDTSCVSPVVMGECPSSVVDPGSPGVNEVQEFSITPADATGGTFTLTFPEGTTAPIAFNADAATVQAAVDAVLGAGNSVVTGGPMPAAMQIEYTGALGQQDRVQVTGDGALLTGPTAPYTVSTSTVTEGAAPVPAVPTAFKPTQRAEAVTFRPVSVVSAVECSTLGGLNVAGVADDSLTRTVGYALAREMLTAAASTRDVGPSSAPNPSLVGTATDLGAAFTSLAAALACLEQSMGEANSDRGTVILASLGALTALKDEGLVWRDGARWRTAAGSLVIGSAGFDGRAPGSTAAPAAGEPLYMYAVTTVWAGSGSRSSLDDVNRAINTASARAEDIALVAFPTCAVMAAAATTVTAC